MPISSVVTVAAQIVCCACLCKWLVGSTAYKQTDAGLAQQILQTHGEQAVALDWTVVDTTSFDESTIQQLMASEVRTLPLSGSLSLSSLICSFSDFLSPLLSSSFSFVNVHIAVSFSLLSSSHCFIAASSCLSPVWLSLAFSLLICVSLSLLSLFLSCDDQIKGTQDKDFSYSFSDSLSFYQPHTITHSHTHTHSLSLVLVVMI